MKNQHTPGPWEADIRIAQAIVVDSHGNAVADIARHEFSVTEQSYSDQRIEANAQLIASAPELLSALKALHSCHRAFSESESWTTLDDGARELAEAAIAKAEGKAE